MATVAQTFDLSTSFLGLPKTLAYGTVRGAGNIVFQQELADLSRIAFVMLGDGCWDSALRLWVNRSLITLPDARVHFHPGLDGAPGDGLAATSTGGDQKVDAFWASVTGGFDPVPYSGYAYLALNIPADPSAPSSSLEILGDYHALKCRQYDNTGVQTAFAWTENQAWWILDFLIRKFIKRSGKVNEPLTAAEAARFDWQSFSDAATYYAAALALGQARFADNCGLVFNQSGTTADAVLEQMLLLCRSYMQDRNGKIALYADKARASVFTFSTDTIEAGSFKADKVNVRPAQNRITANWREVNTASGGGDETRFSPGSKSFDHIAHQLAIGAVGPGIAALQKVREIALDYGINTGERVSRLALHRLIRTLGDDVDSGNAYKAPFTYSVVAPPGAVDASGNKLTDVKPGDLCTVHQSISEEYAGKIFEALEIDVMPDGSRAISGNEYEANAYPDTADAVQVTEAPDPGDGIMPVSGNSNFSYAPTSNCLRATDAGATATIVVELPGGGNFVVRFSGAYDLTINSGPVTGKNFSTLYYVGYKDLGKPPTGGAKTFIVSTTKPDLVDGYIYLGSIWTPRDGDGDTVGNEDGGSGAQFGDALIISPSATNNALLGGNGVVNGVGFEAIRAMNTVAPVTLVAGGAAWGVTVDGGNNYVVQDYYGFPGAIGRYKNIKLKASGFAFAWDTGHISGGPSDHIYEAQISYDGGLTFSLFAYGDNNGSGITYGGTVVPSGLELFGVAGLDLSPAALGFRPNFGMVVIRFILRCEPTDTWTGINNGFSTYLLSLRLECRS